MTSIQQILRPITLTKVISRVAASTDTILQFMGMQDGGKNVSYMGHGRQGSYRVYNHLRSVAAGRAPGTAANRSARNWVGEVPFVYPRMHDSVILPAEELHNLSKIEDPRVRDEAGADYIKRQSMSLGEKAGNWRTALVVGMLRDSLYIHQDGDTWYPTYSSSGATYRINYQMPAGNKTQLDMLGGGSIIDASWATSTTDIPSHLAQINAAFQQLNGGRLTDILINAEGWMNVISNDKVAAVHGTANPPFQVFDRVVGTGPDGTPINEQTGVLTVMPGVTWHITDAGLDIGVPNSETYTKHSPDNTATFLCSPDRPGLYTMYEGSEPIAEYDGGPQTTKIGFNAWSKQSSNPTATEIFVLDNALPVNHVPNSIAYGTVVF